MLDIAHVLRKNPAVTTNASEVEQPRQRADQLESLAQRQAWRSSPERTQWARSMYFLVPSVIVILTGLGGLIGALLHDGRGEYQEFTQAQQVSLGALIGFALGAMLAVYSAQFTLLFRRRAFRERYALAAARGLLREAEDEVASSDDDIDFTSLWFATQRRLDYYHEIATSQSQRSFAYGQTAAGAGLVVVLACTVLAIASGSTAGAVSAGILGGSAAALSGYIGSTFLRTHDVSAQHLRAYFSQPLEASRFLSAERLLSEITDSVRREEAASALLIAIATVPRVSDSH